MIAEMKFSKPKITAYMERYSMLAISSCNSVASVNQPIFYIPKHSRLVLDPIPLIGILTQFITFFNVHWKSKMQRTQNKNVQSVLSQVHWTQTGKLKPIWFSFIDETLAGMRTLEIFWRHSKWLAWNITLPATVLTSAHRYSSVPGLNWRVHWTLNRNAFFLWMEESL